MDVGPAADSLAYSVVLRQSILCSRLVLMLQRHLSLALSAEKAIKTTWQRSHGGRGARLPPKNLTRPSLRTMHGRFEFRRFMNRFSLSIQAVVEITTQYLCIYIRIYGKKLNLATFNLGTRRRT